MSAVRRAKKTARSRMHGRGTRSDGLIVSSILPVFIAGNIDPHDFRRSHE